MKMRNSRSYGFLAVALLAGYLLSSAAWAATFGPGQFLGFFTYTQARIPLARQIAKVEQRLQRNPYLKGLTIRVLWKEEEPEQGHFDWSALDQMIAVARARHIYYTLDPISGIMTPEWVYSAGAKRFDSKDINPHHPTYGQTRSQPVPWDTTYHRLYRDFLTHLAERYGNDPSLLEVTINGHNTTVEMVMPHTPPDMEQWRQLGWSPDLVESDWKSWIDFFGQTFPNTHIGLVLSPMYGESTKRVAESLASYAVSKYARRLILMTAVLHGRRDQSYVFQTHIVLEYPRVLNAQETISSFLTDPQRQGSMQMFIYNMRQLTPLFVRLWPADAQNVQLCSSILSQYDRARSMSVASLRSELESKGAYTTADTYQGPNGQGGGAQRGRFGRFGGRRNPWMGNDSPFQQGTSAQGGYRDQGGTYQGQNSGSYPGENAYPPLNSSPGSDTSSPPNDLSD